MSKIIISVSGLEKSLSARRAWIEIVKSMSPMYLTLVALRKESVDRNDKCSTKEDQNCVALRKESVDRNLGNNPEIYIGYRSLSARRAWIEIWARHRV